jgi:hypothetical protein
METKPLSNAPAQMQQWSRWVDTQLDELGDGAIPVIKAQMERIAANDLRYQQNMATLTFQLNYIIDKVQASADYAAFKTEMDKITSIGLIVPDAPAEPVQQTVKILASGSATWDGSNRITGSGTYDDANMLYQGGASGAGKNTASFWFAEKDLLPLRAGNVTIDSVTLYMKNKASYYGSGTTTAFLGTHAYQTSTRPTTTVNGFTSEFAYGQGKTITLNSTIKAGIYAGTVRGFSLGIAASTSNDDYQYFYGGSYSSKPYIMVTYTTT